MRTAFAAIGMIACFALPIGMAAAAERVALVIGNSNYEFVPELLNPGHDANDLSAKLRQLEFEVIEALDLNQQAMRETIGEFASALQGAEVGLFFFAGHGIQIGGTNYLVPVDAQLQAEADVYVQLLNIRDIMAVMEAAVPTRLVLLDACRNNPLANQLARSMPKSRSASIGQGLARLDAPIGTLIAYATAPEATAADGGGRNSPFTKALLANIDSPGLEARQILTRVRQSVVEATDGQQVPWDSSSLTGDFYFRLELSNKPLPPATTQSSPPANPTVTAMLEEQKLNLNEQDRRDLQAMLNLLKFGSGEPDGRFGPITRQSIARWQVSSDLPASGFLDAQSYSQLLAAADRISQNDKALRNGDAFAQIAIADLIDGDQAAADQLLERMDEFLKLVDADTDSSKMLETLRGDDPWSATNIAWGLLEEGGPLPINEQAAARLFALAGGQGLAYAHSALGHLYFEGIGVESDMEKSYSHYKIAADAGVAEGFYGLGSHYHWGAGELEVDMDEAISFYEQGADGGYWWAMVTLGKIYHEGHHDMVKDPEKARKYYMMVIDGDTPGWASDARKSAQSGLERLENGE